MSAPTIKARWITHEQGLTMPGPSWQSAGPAKPRLTCVKDWRTTLDKIAHVQSGKG